MIDEEEQEKVPNVFDVQDGEELNPYEEIEELMKPKVEPKVKQEIIVKMLSSDLNAGER